ncbi:MAG TPA: glycosyl hydrolase, partial [Hanamia sp.]
MIQKKILPVVITLTLFFFCASNAFSQKNTNNSSLVIPMSKIASGFTTPPDSMLLSVYWYWISDNISKEGVIKDLHAMKKVGINRAFIGNIGLDDVPYGKVKIFSDEWWDIIHTALKTATELNIEIGIFNGPGWSQSGGPWIKPDESMRYLTSSRMQITGPEQLDTNLKQPAKDFQDVRVIAFPAPKEFEKTIRDFNPTISSSPAVPDIKNCMDGDTSTEMIIPSKTDFTLNFETAEPFTARSFTFYPAHRKMKLEGEIQANENGNFKTIKSFTVDRSNDALNVGFNPYAPAAISIPATTTTQFRIVFTNVVPDSSGLREIIISSSPRVEEYAEKTLAKMFPTPFPYWGSYEWPVQPDFHEKDLAIDPSKVIDISKYMNTDGQLKWNVPNGDWIIMRTGMTPTGVHNSPASPEGTGLEVDKMSKKHVAAHFDAFLGKIMKRIPAEDRKTWKVTVEDSYETGGQNWTDGMIEKFKKQFEYDLLPYIPVLSGLVVGSEDKSDRFLWDLRRFVANEVAYQYVAGLREVSHQHGLHTWLENYGHWGFPSTFLMYGGQSDEVAGEFWSEGNLGNIENRAASSSAHIYGKRKVSAESFTAGGKAFQRYPAVMKQRGDRFFTEGINNTLLHLYIEQPYDKLPGVNAPFGNEFNRNNTWFYDLDLFIHYLKRCNFMLQQGSYIADVAYFIGEDAPKMTGTRDPELPKGYSYDYMNAEVIENRMHVKDGRLTLPDGMNYGILVLPKLKTM